MNDMAPSEPTAPKATSGLGGFAYILGGIIAFPVAILLVWIALLPTVGKGGGATAPAGGPVAAPEQKGPARIAVSRIAEALGEPNPFAAFWNDATPVEVMLMPQAVTMPTLDKPGITALSVRAVTDGSDIAMRLSWSDATPDHAVDTARFCDAVAIQFPLTTGTGPMMGFGGGKVHILHWKAVWQGDVDHGYQDDVDLYPNTVHDFYWFADGHSIRDGFKDPRSHAWLIAHSAGNPMTIFTRTQPVEEAFAVGYGTLTSRPRSLTKANGIWTRDTWTVVIQRPLVTDDAEEIQLSTSRAAQVAFAVWDGSAGHVGGKKMWSSWVDCDFTP